MTINCKNDLHSWNGCKCSVCFDQRDEQHDWSKNCEVCSHCFSVRSGQHFWDKDLTCTICGVKLNSNSLYFVAKGRGFEHYEDWNKIQRKNSRAFLVKALNEDQNQPEVIGAFSYYILYNLGKIGLMDTEELNLLIELYKAKTNDPFILSTIGSMLRNRNRIEEALYFFNKTRLIGSTSSLFIPSFLSWSARCYEELEKFESSIQCFQELLHVKPSWLFLYKKISSLHDKMGNRIKMKENNDKYIEFEKKRDDLYKEGLLGAFNESWIDYKGQSFNFSFKMSNSISRDFENSKQKEAFDLHQDKKDLMISLSFIYEHLNLIDKAISAAKLAVEAENPPFYIDYSLSRLFDLYIKKGEFNNALEVTNTATFKHALGWQHLYNSISQCYSGLGSQELSNVYYECAQKVLSATHGLI
jgi:tetratricopeptide (TPR) repeat protein